MGKPFFEVFPSLKLDKKVHDIMEQTTVEKVTATKRKDFLRIYVKSSRLILKQDIWDTERQIKEQLFSQVNMTVKIYEKFELSAQYTPERLMEVYKGCILEEIRSYGHVEYNMFKTAQITYPAENRMCLAIEDTVIARSKEEELIHILEKILVERCGFSLAIQVTYKEAVSGKYAEEDALRLSMEVAEITKRVMQSEGASGSENKQNAETREEKFVQAGKLPGEGNGSAGQEKSASGGKGKQENTFSAGGKTSEKKF